MAVQGTGVAVGLMTDTFITHHAPDGFVGWADGRPPRLAHGETQDAVLAALRDAPSGGQTPDQSVAPPLMLSLILSPERRLASPGDVLKHAGLAERSDISFSITGTEPLNDWPIAESWITGCIDHLSRTESGLRTRFQIETHLPSLPEGFCEFLCRYAGWCSVSVLDSAEDAARSCRRQDYAAQLADLGIRVTATVALRPSSPPQKSP